MTTRWNPKVIEAHFAPGIGSFTSAAIPDVREEHPQADYWVANHFLNTVLGGGRFRPPFKQYALNYLFRSRAAFHAYHLARDTTLGYLEASSPQTPQTRRYCDAITAWEVFLLNWAGCLRIVNTISGDRAFVTGDGSPEERAYKLSNAIKHWAESEDFDPDATLPMWLANDGLSSTSAGVTYEEAADLLRDMARLADDLQNPAGMQASAEAEATNGAPDA